MQKSLKSCGKSGFKTSNGWLESFREIHQIGFSEVCAKTECVCGENVADWNGKLTDMTKRILQMVIT